MAKKFMGLMVDLETLGTQPTTIVREIAYSLFDWETLEPVFGCNFYPNIQEQKEHGRTSTDSTIQWWRLHAEADRKLTYNSERYGVSCVHAAKEFCNAIRKFKNEYSLTFVARGATTFDYPILVDFCKMFGEEFSFQFFRIYDMRSLTSMVERIMGITIINKDKVEHTAEEDCINQIADLRKVKALLLPFNYGEGRLLW